MDDVEVILKTFRKLVDANVPIKKDNITYVIEHKTEDFKIYFTLYTYQVWLEELIDNCCSATRVDSEVVFEKGACMKVYRHLEVAPLDLMNEDIKKMLFEIQEKYEEQQDKFEEAEIEEWLNDNK